MDELRVGVRRVTFPLPLGIDHVHCYLLERETGGWTLVDTSLGFEDPERHWRPVLDELPGPVEQIVVTHFHPDHVGGSADLAAMTGATVFQGRLDHAQCEAVWGEQREPSRLPGWFARHGLPPGLVSEKAGESEGLAQHVHAVRDPTLLDAGDVIDGWEVLHLPGHADGHIALLRDGVLAAGDTILGEITPQVGLWPESRPDPLADYLDSLSRIAALGLEVALPGHGPVLDDPRARAEEIAAHHADRLNHAHAALDGEPRSAYDVSLALWSRELPRGQRRFALAETLAHLERLVRSGKARRVEDGGAIMFERS